MKKKLIGLFICMLLIATAILAVKSLQNNVIDSTVPSHPLTGLEANWTKMQKLLASDGTTDDEFGISVSLSGNIALIGADGDDDNGNYSGSAYVFIHTGTTWTQQAKLLLSYGETEDEFGYSVSLDRDTALIGASESGIYTGRGSAYVFIRTGTTWT